jgi:hypothetical protein
MAKASLNFCNRAEKEANSLRSDSLLLFSARLQKFKAPSRQNVKGQRQRPTLREVGLVVWAGAQMVWLFFLPYAAPWLFFWLG